MGDYPFVLPSGGVTLPVSVANGGTGQTTAAAGYSALSPMTTAGDMEYEVAAGTAARLPVGAAGQVLSVSAGEPAWAAGMTLLATTGTAGYALVNGTGNILTWTAPNDGNMHRVSMFGNLWTTSTETGGAISVSITDPGGHSSGNQTIDAGNHGVNFHQLSNGYWNLLVEAGSTVTISQTSALTGGASTLWMELWGS
jgi:hypothetical protein